MCGRNDRLQSRTDERADHGGNLDPKPLPDRDDQQRQQEIELKLGRDAPHRPVDPEIGAAEVVD